mmetsp:Transcript_61781/g.130415  ORF Transcript_61781/g.130415 Transcript_61781/m.130415 type:complete len:339 (+) Transcript_61781:551-1567(+)
MKSSLSAFHSSSFFTNSSTFVRSSSRLWLALSNFSSKDFNCISALSRSTSIFNFSVSASISFCSVSEAFSCKMVCSALSSSNCFRASANCCSTCVFSAIAFLFCSASACWASFHFSVALAWAISTPCWMLRALLNRFSSLQARSNMEPLVVGGASFFLELDFGRSLVKLLSGSAPSSQPKHSTRMPACLCQACGNRRKYRTGDAGMLAPKETYFTLKASEHPSNTRGSLLPNFTMGAQAWPSELQLAVNWVTHCGPSSKRPPQAVFPAFCLSTMTPINCSILLLSEVFLPPRMSLALRVSGAACSSVTPIAFRAAVTFFIKSSKKSLLNCRSAFCRFL